MEKIPALTLAMMEYDKGAPGRIQHFTKVHSYAKLIGQEEGLSGEALLILEAAALVHDIGIRPAMEKYGRCDGKLQEEEGPAPAREMLLSLGFSQGQTDRVCYLVAHHHTYEPVNGLDHRILLEADFLVNLYEGSASQEAVQSALEKAFRTECGIKICKLMFRPE